MVAGTSTRFITYFVINDLMCVLCVFSSTVGSMKIKANPMDTYFVINYGLVTGSCGGLTEYYRACEILSSQSKYT